MRSIIFTSLFLTATLVPVTVNSQNLFGNPSCIDWLKLPLAEKTSWSEIATSFYESNHHSVHGPCSGTSPCRQLSLTYRAVLVENR